MRIIESAPARVGMYNKQNERYVMVTLTEIKNCLIVGSLIGSIAGLIIAANMI